MTINIERNLAGKEDLALGLGKETQMRAGKTVEVTRINAHNIPFDDNHSIADVIPDKATLDEYKNLKDDVKEIIDEFNSMAQRPPQSWKDYVDVNIQPYRSDLVYPKGTITRYINDLYISIQDTPKGGFNASHWSPLPTRFKGLWEDSRRYLKGDVVSYENTLWVAIGDSTGEMPTPSSAYWDLPDQLETIQDWRVDRIYKLGRVVIGNDKRLYYCLKEGSVGVIPDTDTTGEWKPVYTPSEVVNGSNVGDFKLKLIDAAEVTDKEPGWLVLGGYEVPRGDYPDLWKYVEGTKRLITQAEWDADDAKKILFGDGDGSTTFTLPNYTLFGGHPRAISATKGMYEHQPDQIRNIKGEWRTYIASMHNSPGYSGAFVPLQASQYSAEGHGHYNGPYQLAFDASKVVSTGDQVQPYGICLLPLIKY